jgi:hypothetical protein
MCIQDWLQLDEGEPGFQLLTEEEIAAVIFSYLFSSALPILWSRDSVVGILTSYRLDSRGVKS